MSSMHRGTTFRALAKRAGAGALLGAAMTLSACGGDAAPEATAVEGVIEGVSIENARIVLAPVEGNPAALYFDLKNEGARSFSIDRFDVVGSESTMLHQFMEYDFKVQMMETTSVPVRAGDTVEFKPGDLHVMVMEPSADLAAGGSTDVTMKISGGDTHEFTAEIRAAGEER